jgi:hypothetical protein
MSPLLRRVDTKDSLVGLKFCLPEKLLNPSAWQGYFEILILCCQFSGEATGVLRDCSFLRFSMQDSSKLDTSLEACAHVDCFECFNLAFLSKLFLEAK